MATAPPKTMALTAVVDLKPDPAQFKRDVFLALIPKYMTTSTGGIAAATTDAIADVIRLKAAYDELMKVAP